MKGCQTNVARSLGFMGYSKVETVGDILDKAGKREGNLTSYHAGLTSRDAFMASRSLLNKRGRTVLFTSGGAM